MPKKRSKKKTTKSKVKTEKRKHPQVTYLQKEKIHPIELLMKVRYMMEYMTLCADPTAFHKGINSSKTPSKDIIIPSPDGVPMGIIIMPEFVIDVDTKLIPSPPSLSPRVSQPLDVGGRSARLVWLLQAFGGEANGLYRLNYLTKIGSIGEVILKERFHRLATLSGFQPISLRYAFLMERRDWLAIYGASDERPSGLEILDESQHLDPFLSIDDITLSPYSLANVFSNTRYIVISGKRSQNIHDAIRLAVHGLKDAETHPHKLAEFFRTRYTGSPLKPRVPIGILLDLSTFDTRETQAILNIYSEECSKIKANYELHTTLICKKINRLKLSKVMDKATVISFASNIVSVHTSEYKEKIEVPGVQTSLDLPLTREAFTAGYVLASASSLAWTHLNLWYLYFPKLRSLSCKGHEKWPIPASDQEVPITLDGSSILPMLSNNPYNVGESLSIRDRVYFAALIASHTHEMPLTYHDIIAHIFKNPPEGKEYDTSYWISNLHKAPHGLIDDEFDVASLVSETRRQCKIVNPTYINDLKRRIQSKGDLHVRNTVPRFVKCHSKTLSLHVSIDDPDPFVASVQWGDIARNDILNHEKKAIQRVVMFDLDSALLEPTSLRRACWMKALSVFFRLIGIEEDDSPSKDEAGQNWAIRLMCESATEVYENFVYGMNDQYYKLFSYNPDISPELLPCDFRQIWNHPYSWATLLWVLQISDHNQLSEKGKVRVSASKRWRQMLKNHNSVVSCDCSVCKRIKNLLGQLSQSTRAVGRELLQYLPQFVVQVNSAREAFWDIDYPCYAQAPSCVETIRSMEDCEVYVVSEGDEDTQLHKLKCTGLDVLFPKHRVLTTGAASATEDIERALIRLRGYLNFALKYAAEDKYFVQVENRDTVKTLIEILHVLGGKQGVGFYCAVVDAIRLNPRAPAEILRSFSRRTTTGTEVSRHAMQFFMIGDRYDSDCRPPLEMFGDSRIQGKVPIGTCRLLSGKRASKFCPPDKDDHSTLFVCDTLAQCKHLLTSPNTWDQVQTINPDMNIPPVLLTTRGRQIVHRSENPGHLQKPVVDTFRSLAWSRYSDALRNEPEAMYLVRQLERDLAVCSPIGQKDLYRKVAKKMSEWWNDKTVKKDSQRTVSFGVYKGALKVLESVNFYRSELCTSPLNDDENEIEQLAYTLGSHLLKALDLPTLLVFGAQMEAVKENPFVPIEPADLINAIPYSKTGKEIVGSRSIVDKEPIAANNWLQNARKLNI
jgi:hypothetical protein